MGGLWGVCGRVCRKKKMSEQRWVERRMGGKEDGWKRRMEKDEKED